MLKTISFSLCAFLISTCAYSFKLDTHVWVGAQVVEDVSSDGKVTIPPFGDFNVDADIVTALREHPKAYLYGNIGPDFFPDVLTGQMIIHPGAAIDEHGDYEESAWNTDDWFKHLLSTRGEMEPEELAFSYGFLAHGAADFWAHTYVNTYAGNIFNLLDGDLAEAEIRHYTLEGFVNKYTPDVVTSNGQNVGKGINVISAYQGEFPSEFIANQLILHDDIQDQLGTSLHLKVATSLKNNIPEWAEFSDTLRDPLYKIIGDLFERYRDNIRNGHEKKQDLNEEFCNAPAQEMPDSFAAQVAIERGAVIDEIHDESEEIIQEAYNDNMDRVSEADNKFHERTMQYEAEGAELLSSAHDEFSRAEERIFDKKHELEQELLSLDQSLRQKSCEFAEDVFMAPIGIHSYLVEELPFGEEINDQLVDFIDPLGVINFEDPLDPLGLFGGGSSSEPARVETETGDRAYFQSRRDHFYNLMEKNGLHSLISSRTDEQLINFYYNVVLSEPEIQLEFDKYYEHQAKVRFYDSTLANLEDGSTVTIYSVGSKKKGFSSESSGSWFCNTVNGFADDSLTGALNRAQSLENELNGFRNDLVSATEKLRDALVDAAEKIHTARHQFNKKLQQDTNELLDLAQEYTSLQQTGQAFADAEQALQDKVQATFEDICSDVKKIETFLDDGAQEAAPFVGSYLLDKYARSSGYKAKDGALYYEWFYFFLRTWEVGVNEAIAAYPDTQREVADAVVDATSTFEDYKEPLTQYLICEAPKFVAVPSHAAHTLCVLQATAESLINTADSVKREHDRFVEKYLLGGIPEDFRITKEKIDQAIEDAIYAYARDRFAGNEAFELLMHVKEGSLDDPHVVNSLFSTTDNNYLVFDENSDPFTERVKSEMYLKDGKFDPQKFAPAHNAVVLAKLTLLRASELNRLVQVAGGHSGSFGTTLFNTSTSPFNILIDGVRTIDGDHQWLEQPPRYIRQDGSQQNFVLENTSYQHVGEKGFRLYQDELARKNVFNKIFLGPINAGIEAPSIFNMDDIIPSLYTYRPCEFYPYPNGEDDQTCLMSWLIPVLHMLQ